MYAISINNPGVVYYYTEQHCFSLRNEVTYSEVNYFTTQLGVMTSPNYNVSPFKLIFVLKVVSCLSKYGLTIDYRKGKQQEPLFATIFKSGCLSDCVYNYDGFMTRLVRTHPEL